MLRVRGIAIGANWSWLFILALVVWSLAAGAFPASYPGLSDVAYIVMGVVAGVLFFGSILLHELGHAFRALREGMKIDGITLWLLGGVARFKGNFPSAGAEFRIAVAGPIVSFAIAAVFGILTFLGDRVEWAGEIQGVVDYLWRINALVAAFNLVPALPLDGGRILRSWLWHRQANFADATRSAARAGTAFGALLALVGILNFFSDSGGGGLWFVFLGWFLIQAARSEASVGLMETALAGRKVRDVMSPDPQVVEAGTSIEEFLENIVAQRGHSTYPVVDAERLVGLVSLRAAGQVEPERRDSTTVKDVMLKDHEVEMVEADARLMDVIGSIHGGVGRSPVVEDGKAVGVISIADVTHALEVENARGLPTRSGSRRSGFLVWAVVAALMLGVAGYLYRPPMVVLKPGSTLDVTEGIRITGVPTDDVEGSYLLTSITISRPTGWGLAWALVSGQEVVSRAQVLPPDIPSGEFFRRQRDIFDESQALAAAAAAETSGLNASLEGGGAVVRDVIAGSPADGDLRPGDVILQVNGESIGTVSDLQRVVRDQPTGSRFEITFERNGSERTVRLESEQLSGAPEGTPGLGVVIETLDLDVDLPFEVSFEDRDIGGPSAGLVYALAIADMLDPGDFARGRVVAATGTIDIEGRIGEIGGVDLKAEAARAAGASIFLVPAGQAEGLSADGLRTLGVATLRDALKALGTGTG